KEGVISITLQKLNNKFKIEISDNGKGIAEEYKSKIFTPNFTTKSGGTGLGLSMVKSIVETKNGSITFESEFDMVTKYGISLLDNMIDDITFDSEDNNGAQCTIILPQYDVKTYMNKQKIL